MDEGKPQKQQPGHPKILTDQMKYFICVQTLYFPEMSGSELANKIFLLYGVTVSDNTINYCRKSYPAQLPLKMVEGSIF